MGESEWIEKLKENINLEIKYCQDGAVSWDKALQNIKRFVEDEMKRPISELDETTI